MLDSGSEKGSAGGTDDGGDSTADEFHDGLDEHLIGDDEDRERLEEMTEKEREQELYNRIERREVLRTRWASLAHTPHSYVGIIVYRSWPVTR